MITYRINSFRSSIVERLPYPSRPFGLFLADQDYLRSLRGRSTQLSERDMTSHNLCFGVEPARRNRPSRCHTAERPAGSCRPFGLPPSRLDTARPQSCSAPGCRKLMTTAERMWLRGNAQLVLSDPYKATQAESSTTRPHLPRKLAIDRHALVQDCAGHLVCDDSSQSGGHPEDLFSRLRLER